MINDQQLFETIATDLADTGLSVHLAAMPEDMVASLQQRAWELTMGGYNNAGVGRNQQQMVNTAIRGDEICWLEGESAGEQLWLAWMQELQTLLNRHLLLGLFSFESHFAHYPPGTFYKKHVDAFKGQANRVLSVVAYLNDEWEPDAGGELVLYPEGSPTLKVAPTRGTLVVFLSEDIPHEVLTSQRDRFSIAGWFRVNSSSQGRVDPPR